MRTAFVLVYLLIAGCSNGTGPPGMCGHAAGLDDAEAGTGACGVGRHALSCTDSSGAGCLCITDELTCGDSCGIATCQNKCRANEYAVSCGGPPHDPQGTFTYADPPAGCRSVFAGPGGGSMYCCPCQ